MATTLPLPFQDRVIAVTGASRGTGLALARYLLARGAKVSMAATSEETLAKALESGCTFWDSATLYGVGHNEELIGGFLRETGAREKVFLASKCGLPVSALLPTDTI